MKRTSKILAFLLSLCIVLAMAVTFAFAAETNQLDASQYGAGITNVNYNTSGFKTDYHGGVVNTFNRSIVTENGNSFMKITKNPSYITYEQLSGGGHLEQTHKEYEYANGFTGLGVSATELKNFDYLVWSLDFMSDKVGENGKLNYLDESWFGTYGNAYYYNYIVKDSEGDWYMSSDSEYSSNDAPLATEPGVWNNLTVVISRADNKMYGFVNGKNYSQTSVAAAMKIDRIVYNVWNSYDIYNPDWSISVDNVSFNTYNIGYESGVSFGLSDYFNNLDLTRYISECGDIVHNSGYVSPGATPGYTVVKNGVSTTYSSSSKFASVIPNLVAGDSVTANVKLDTLLDAKGISYVKAQKGYAYYYLITKSAAADANIIKGTLASMSSGGTSNALDWYYEGLGKADAFTQATALKRNFFGIKNGKEFTGTVSNSNYNFYLGPNGSTSTKEYPTSANYKYVTMNFDIAASGYVYLPDEADDGVYRYTGSLAGLTETELKTAKLSYYEGGAINVLSSGWDFTWNYVSKDGKWYLSNGNKVWSEDDVPLKDGVGEWNHITLMVDINSRKLIAFVNGQYATTQNLGAYEFERFSFLRLDGVTFSEFDMRIGGVDINFYKSAYDSGVAVFGVDDFFALDEKKYDASFIEDAFVGDDFKLKVERGSDVLYFRNLAEALTALENGDTLYYDGDMILFCPISQDLESFKVVANSVVLESDAMALHTYSDGVIKRNSVYTAIWYDENDQVIRTDLVGVDAIPDYKTLSFTTSVKGDYNQSKAWKWAREGSTEYAPLETIAGIAVGETVVIVPDTSIIAWNDNYGESIEVESWFAGSIAARDFSDLEELEVFDNGWYELAYFWTASEDMIPAEDMTVKSGEDVAYYSIIRPVEAFTGLKYNYSLGSMFYVSHYVPVPDEDSGVIVTGANYVRSMDSAGLTSAKPYFDDIPSTVAAKSIVHLDIHSTVSVSGQDYYRFHSGDPISSFGWYSLQGFEVCFEVEYEGETYELSSKLALTRLGTKSDNAYTGSYVYKALEIYECGSEECALIVNMARYISQAYATQGSFITFGDVDTILNTHANCGCIKSLESYLPTEAPATDPSGLAIAPGFAASFYAKASHSSLAIYVPKEIADANEDLSVTATIKGAILDGATSLQTVTINFYKLMMSVDGTEVPDTANVDDVSCYIYIPEFIKNSVYNADLVYNVTVSYGGNEYKGTYSLQTYLYNLNETTGFYVYNTETGKYEQNEEITTITTNHRAIKLLLAQRAYAEAARNYKLN